ncbi:NAD(P)/FAD-dependent oxidoreductase [Thermopolyspora sp. NPDC052614]|uniref:FAD-dependent oxidoreductase n=1 Tax=Thermopolyspora sp. NPDC052614 TaxID=3155682 RepID=UPI003430104F
MKTVVIGAGIGGLATALGLAGSGLPVEVYERAETFRAAGNGVILWPGATGILKELGVDTTGLGRPMHRGELLSSGGSLLVWTDMKEVSDRYGHDTLLVSRGDVVKRLGAALPDGIVRFGKRCTSVRESAGGAIVEFEDGSRTEADVVVGADGYRSAVRDVLLPGDSARFTGVATWHGVGAFPHELIGGTTARTYFGKIGICAVHPVGDGLLHWAFEAPWKPGGPRQGPWLPRLRQWFGDWHPAIRDLLAAVDEADVHVFPHALHTVRRRWGRGPLTLLGDAAHVIPPRAGMGANQALEDAWVLAHALAAGAADPPSALRAYEDARVKRVRRVASSAGWMSKSNNMLLMLRFIRRAVPMNRLTHATVRGGSNYLNDDLPALSRKPGLPVARRSQAR